MPKRREKFIQVERSRHGKTVYYFRRARRRYRLPDDYGSAGFWSAYRKLLQERGEETYIRPPSPAQVRTKRAKMAVWTAVRRCLSGAKARAAARGREFTLTEEWALATIERQQYRCAITRIPFFAECDATSHVRPFAPSIDRIDPRGGYTADNVRIVIFALNVMLFDWGEDVFARVANCYRANQAKRRPVPPLAFLTGGE